MERVSQRESFLINLAAERRSDDSPSSSTSVPRRRRISSDFDFNDVFGGPPRRFSVHNSDEAMSTEDGLSIRSFSSEKPVFGEESIVSRRKNHQSNDFFDDIYRGGNKSCSSPGKGFVSSLPGSRIMSPSRTLPPKLDSTRTSLPAQFSLPATVMNVMDYPTFASSSSSKKKEGTSIGRSSSSYQISRFSSQTLMQEQDHYRSDVWSSSHPSSLSNEFSPRKEESTYTAVSNETEKTRDSNDTSKSTEAPVYSDEFHFSIYKWPRYEIPIVIPLHQRIKLKSKENDLTKSSNATGSGNEDTVIGLLPSNVCHVDTPNISVNLESSRMEVEELGEANTSFISRPTTVDTISSYKSEDTKRNSVNDTSFTKETKKEATVFTEEVHKPELKRMHSIIRDGFDQQGRGDTTVKVEGKDNVAKTAKLSDSNAGASKVVKEYEVKKVGSHRKEVNKARTQGSPKYFSENPKRSGARGKVKEFAKLFNQDSSSKAKIKGEGPTQSGIWEGKVDGAKVSHIRVGPASTYKMDCEMHLPSENKLRDASFVREKHHLPEKPTIHISTHKSSDNKEPDPLSGLTPESPKLAPDEDIDDLSQINYMIEELSDDQVKLSVATEDKETTKALDAKIHKWSTGKKGNIRSLLSTLQYVLWAESGWKPVPLVNIIEGNGVKKAYQRAMLCLHPDKLQQKGASPHQKYTAEKVFDILQEAWDQFNILGST